MVAHVRKVQIYDGDGDMLMQKEPASETERILLTPDTLPTRKPELTPRIRIMWGQHLLEDLLAGRYRSLVCAVNGQDNHSGIISQLAAILPTSQWDESSITSHARQVSAAMPGRPKVLKFDMDTVEVLAILRPTGQAHLTIDDLAAAFKVVAQMVRTNPIRRPSASVSFLEARANKLVDSAGHEPTFETVLRTMHEAGYQGDVYPSPSMWQVGPVGLFPRYPFSPTLENMRTGGF